MRRSLLLAVLAFVCLVKLGTSSQSWAQNYISAVGNPSFGVNIPLPNGYINVSNGDLHLEIPLATHKQRGALQLNERLVYDSRIWEVVQYSGSYWWPVNVPNSSAGWRFVKGNETGTLGTAYNQTQNTSCWNGTYNAPYTTDTTYYNWADPNGTVHPFAAGSTTYTVPSSCSGSGPNASTWSGYATDASGYYATVTSNNSGNVTVTIKDASGNQVYPQVIDRFGNFWTNDGNGNLVDDLGRTPILVTTNGNVTYYDVLAPNGTISNNGTRVRYTVTTEQVTVTTSFNQSHVTEYQNNGSHSATIPAIQSIGLPDGSSYQFAYDSYGEIQSVTLPTGGVVSYGWTNYTDSYQNVNRWLSSSTIAGNKTLYTSSVSSKCSVNSTGCQQSVNVHRPSGDETVYTFTLNNGAWDTTTTAYSGAASAMQTKLSRVNTYTLSQACTIPGCNGAQNITQSLETDYLPDANETSQIETDYANPQTAQITDLKQWDAYPGGSAQPTLPTRQANYGYTNFDRTSETDLDAAGHTTTSTTYTYTATATATSGIVGHGSANAGGPYLTTITVGNNGSSSASYTYDDTGALITASDPTNNFLTTYKYDSTHTFITEIDKPSTTTNGTTVSHITKASFDPGSGAILSSDDENSVAKGQALTTRYSYESAGGRLHEIDYPDGGKTVTNYESPTQWGQNTYQSSSVFADTEVLLDPYGRTYRTAVANGQGSNPWYQQDTCLDVNGNVLFVSSTYQGSGFGQASVCSGAGNTFTYDTFERTTQVAHADGTSVQYAYTGGATQVTDENGVSRITQVDGLGRTTTVCEISSLTLNGVAPVSCGTDRPGTGFVTSYAYSVANQTTTITQGAQTRIFQTDSLGRPSIVTEPERGTTTYSYGINSTGMIAVRRRPKANQTGSALTTTTSQYDAVGRVTAVSYDDGLTPAKAFAYDINSWQWTGFTPTNLVGQLYSASVSQAATVYSYDSMGRVINQGVCIPSGCGNSAYDKHLAYTYDLAGNLTSESDPITGTIAYGRSVAGEITSVTNQTFTLAGASGTSALVSSVQNGPNGPLTYSLGNGLSQFNNYDSLGRLNGSWVCVGAPSYGCPAQRNGYVLTWSGQRVAGSTQDNIGSGINYQYDDFNRIKGVTSSGGQAPYTYTYDRYGNRLQQIATQGGTNSNLSFNANNQINSTYYAYDAAGNMTNDPAHSYTYDAEGNVLTIDNGSTGSYLYDAFNRRVHEQPTSQLAMVYDIFGRATSFWPTAATASEGHIFSDGMQIGDRSGDGHTYFKHTDWLHTDRVHTDLNGATVATYVSLPFGDGGVENSSSTYGGWDFLRFGDMDYNVETGTNHAIFRNYSPQQGRWTTPDPYDGSYDLGNPQSFNRYAYVLNNPLANIDPDGEDGTGLGLCYLTASNCGAGGGGGGVGGGGDGLGQEQLYYNSVDVTYTSVNGGNGVYNYQGDLVAQFSSNNGTGVVVDSYGNVLCGNVFCGTLTTGLLGGGFSSIGGGGTGNGGYAPNSGGYAREHYCSVLSPNCKTPSQCLGAVASSEGAAALVDTVGAFPVEGNALRIAQLGVGGVGYVVSLANHDAPGAVGGIVAAQTLGVGMSARALGTTALEAAPVIGNVLSAVMAVRDAYKGYQHYQACINGRAND